MYFERAPERNNRLTKSMRWGNRRRWSVHIQLEKSNTNTKLSRQYLENVKKVRSAERETNSSRSSRISKRNNSKGVKAKSKMKRIASSTKRSTKHSNISTSTRYRILSLTLASRLVLCVAFDRYDGRRVPSSTPLNLLTRFLRSVHSFLVFFSSSSVRLVCSRRGWRAQPSLPISRLNRRWRRRQAYRVRRRRRRLRVGLSKE
jgi:hypothetical protein